MVASFHSSQKPPRSASLLGRIANVLGKPRIRGVDENPHALAVGFRRRVGLPFLCALALAMICGRLTSAVSENEVTPKLKQTLVRQIGKRLERRAFAYGVDFGQWSAHAGKHQAAIDGAMTEQQLGDALSAALREFGVSHLWIWTPEDMRLRREGRQGGIGVKTVAVDDGLLVTMVLPDSAAESSGLQRGDIILTIDGEPAGARPMAGRTGESRLVRWRRRNSIQQARLTLDGARRAAPPALRWLDGGLAWLTVPTFSHGVYEQAQIDALFEEAAEATAMVLDLRSNGGGRGSNVEHLLAHLLPAGTEIFGEVYREDLDAFLRKNQRPPESLTELLRANGQVIRSRSDVTKTPYAGPLAVLIDGRSGSGADILPAVIQDTGRGIVVGTRSAGKAVSGDDHALTGGFVLFYPHAEMVRIGGKRMEGNPVQPDVQRSAVQTANDEALEPVLTERLLHPATRAGSGERAGGSTARPDGLE